MAEEEYFIDTPNEPQAIIPKSSLISMEDISPRHKRELSQNLVVLSKISKGKFPVFLAMDPRHKKKYAMKIFTSDVQNNDYLFKNEIRYASLFHQNVIKIAKFGENKTIVHEDQSMTASFILTEYAPYGDFFDVLTTYKSNFTEQLCRTYFRQLIEGLEYLHKRNIAHLDIKLENLLVGEDYKLKIADFDLSCYTKEMPILAKGTRCHRSPELKSKQCRNGAASDIYSAGIILFILVSGGIIPHTEDHLYKGVNLFWLLNNDDEEFWQRHCQFQNKKPSDFSYDFRELFHGMTEFDPEERFTIDQIKNSRWYNGPVYSDKELKSHLQSFLKPKF